jgi:hypothetical protein
MPRPDIIVLGPEWPTRALLRAQLLEEGYDVMATDVWPIPHRSFLPAVRPRGVVVDLHGLAEPRRVLDELRDLIEADRVLVLTALGTLATDDVERAGFHVVRRPASIGEIVAAARQMLGRASGGAARSSENAGS